MKTLQSITASTRNRIITAYCNRNDFRTDRHIVVFESDDWGSIRMSNKKSWDELLKKGYAVDKRPYERFDTLESPEDMEALFEVLSKHKDCKGNCPLITANMLMVNPNFDEIEESGFWEYHYEPIAKTYEHYYGNAKVLELMRQGKDEGLFKPQSHGREHFNVALWMKGLQSRNEDLLTAFRYRMCGIAPKNHPESGNLQMQALLATNNEEQEEIDIIVKEGLQMFEQLWGYKSETFVAPCYLWNESIEKVLVAEDVKLIQTSRSSKPAYNTPPMFLFTGKKNKMGLIYSVRNCQFEPATNQKGTTVDGLLAQVDKTFAERKIAVFSTHRINYVSGIDARNRDGNLRLLNVFLTKLIERYPDTEFLSSDKLVELLK